MVEWSVLSHLTQNKFIIEQESPAINHFANPECIDLNQRIKNAALKFIVYFLCHQSWYCVVQLGNVDFKAVILIDTTYQRDGQHHSSGICYSNSVKHVAFKTTFFAIFIAVYMHAHLSLCTKNTPLNNIHARIIYAWIILKQCL